MKLRSLLLALLFGVLPLTASRAVSLSITVAPPVLPVYEQPVCPVEGYLWTPGYWAYDDGGYYWVEGVWVAPPRVGYLWTPPYWGFADGFYAFHGGYWGPTIGFYGGVNYGFGYGGYGYDGGRWDGRVFRYNTAITRVDVRNVHNTYVDRTVVRENNNRTSFNGPGGVNARPDARQQAAAGGKHLRGTSGQVQAQRLAQHGAHIGTPAANNGRQNTGRGGERHGRGRGPDGTPATREPRTVNNPPDRGSRHGQGRVARQGRSQGQPRVRGPQPGHGQGHGGGGQPRQQGHGEGKKGHDKH